ncbi:hypothetical protein BDN72DRAFT_832341 [Pluteus cervinus]|uniref:Uncharacterized protein n=1 Tax=Pluteus cervinus TaxID=181527 RepID=A0ACD3BCW9_9AGAR|nr:hypothetical protein BDN72DRAFT_832341 [Pluteus cervinus]
MTVAFTFPPHPSSSTTQTKAPAPVASSEQPPSTRDPHDLPSFNSKSLSDPAHPVLYLPPLLSSLPEQFPSIPVSDEHPALVTETRLPDIDPASLSLHKALHHFRPLNEGYANLPYAEAFTWSQLSLPEDEEREWYCVAFRSKRKAGSDGEPLYEADAKAHAEAVRNGGLIMYWYGIPNQQTGMNLATCIWQSRKHAIAANSRPHHIRAMRLAAEAYEVYNLERHVLRKAAGETGVTIEPFQGGEVGW